VVQKALEEVWGVVHLAAAFRGVPEAKMGEVNVEATRTLGWMSNARRFVFASTQQVYGPGRGRPAREDDPLQPPADGAYPKTKAQAEEVLGEFQRGGLDLRMVRLGFVYGDGDPHLEESLRWAGGWPSHKRLHLVHHADVGQAIMRLLLAEGLDKQRTFNIADDAPLTAHELHVINGRPVPPEAATRALADPWEGILDTSLAREKLGFRPLYPTIYAAQDAGSL
jgi:nucleoside-diphosphate-sugar epimerase